MLGNMTKKNPNPSPSTRFKKGVVNNPNGARAHDPELKKLKALSKAEFVEIGNLVIKSSMNELKTISDNLDNPVLQIMISRVCLKIASKGDMTALNVLLDRLIGKVREDVKFTGDVSLPAQIIVTLPSNGREAKLD